MPTAISALAEACTIFSEEGSEQGNEAFHWYGKGLLEGVRMEGQVFEYAMEGFDPEPPLGAVYLEGLRFRLISRNDSENWPKICLLPAGLV